LFRGYKEVKQTSLPLSFPFYDQLEMIGLVMVLVDTPKSKDAILAADEETFSVGFNSNYFFVFDVEAVFDVLTEVTFDHDEHFA
jgi:hypothetical protein